MRGAGKTRLGALLAQRLRLRVLCTDSEVLKRYDERLYSSLKQAIQSEGWEKFRALERQVLLELVR